jgi:hypothetical protein
MRRMDDNLGQIPSLLKDGRGMDVRILEFIE